MDFKKIGILALLFLFAIGAKSLKHLTTNSKTDRLVVNALIDDKETYDTSYQYKYKYKINNSKKKMLPRFSNRNNQLQNSQKSKISNKKSWQKKFSKKIALKGKKKKIKVTKKTKKKKKKKVFVTKKKKKKKEEDKGKTKELEVAKNEPGDKTPQEQLISNNQNTTALLPFNAAVVPTTNNNTDDEKSLEEWLAILIPTPSFKQTDRFINFFKLQQVSASVYFSVVDEMLQDPRKKMQELAVRLLSAAPSAESFIQLNQIASSEPSLQPAALTGLKRYHNISTLNILKSLLNPSVSDNIQIAAIDSIQQLTRNVINTQNQGGDLFILQDDQQGFINPQATALSTISPSLESVIGTSQNAELNRRAQDLSSYLEEVFGKINSITPVAVN